MAQVPQIVTSLFVANSNAIALCRKSVFDVFEYNDKGHRLLGYENLLNLHSKRQSRIAEDAEGTTTMRQLRALIGKGMHTIWGRLRNRLWRWPRDEDSLNRRTSAARI
jgi:hypothetical protein